MYLDIVLALSTIADAASMRPTFVRDELENLSDSDYESDCRLEIPDILQEVVRYMICGTIQTRKKFPTHQSACALGVNKLFPVPADHLAKLLAIESSTRP